MHTECKGCGKLEMKGVEMETFCAWCLASGADKQPKPQPVARKVIEWGPIGPYVEASEVESYLAQHPGWVLPTMAEIWQEFGPRSWTEEELRQGKTLWDYSKLAAHGMGSLWAADFSKVNKKDRMSAIFSCVNLHSDERACHKSSIQLVKVVAL